MSVDKKQTSRYTNEELQILKTTFADREEALYALRKHLYQLKLSKQDIVLIDSFDKDVWDVLKIGLLPTIEGKMPIKQEVDLWMLADISNKTVVEAHPHIMARKLMENYFEGIFDKDKPKFYFSGLSILTHDKEQNYVNITAKQLIVAHVETQLEMLLILAGRKDETPEETMKRLHANSNQ